MTATPRGFGRRGHAHPAGRAAGERLLRQAI